MSRIIYTDTTTGKPCILDEHSRHTGGGVVAVEYVERQPDGGYHITQMGSVAREHLVATSEEWPLVQGEYRE